MMARVGGRPWRDRPVPNLHPRLVEAVTRRLEMARAAAIGWDSAVRIQLNHDLVDAPLADAIMAYLDDNDPDDAIRRYERDLKVLERHSRMPGFLSAWACLACQAPFPEGLCPEGRDLLDVYPEVTP